MTTENQSELKVNSRRIPPLPSDVPARSLSPLSLPPLQLMAVLPRRCLPMAVLGVPSSLSQVKLPPAKQHCYPEMLAQGQDDVTLDATGFPR